MLPHQLMYRAAAAAGCLAPTSGYDSLRAPSTCVSPRQQIIGEELQKLKYIGQAMKAEALTREVKQSTAVTSNLMAGNQFDGDQQRCQPQQQQRPSQPHQPLQPDLGVNCRGIYVGGGGAGNVQPYYPVTSTPVMPIYPWMRSLNSGMYM